MVLQSGRKRAQYHGLGQAIERFLSLDVCLQDDIFQRGKAQWHKGTISNDISIGFLGLGLYSEYWTPHPFIGVS